MATDENLVNEYIFYFLKEHHVLQHCTWFTTGNATVMKPEESAKHLI